VAVAFKQRALASVGTLARYVPVDQAQIFAFVASPRVRADPWALYRRLHHRGPVRSGPYGTWMVASHAGILTVLRDATTTVDESQAVGLPSAGGDPTPAFNRLMDRSLLFSDPPDHSRLRRLVSRSFTPRTVDALRGPVEALVDEMLSGLRRRGSADLIADFALPFPVAVICELLGIPESERARFLAWARDIAPRLDISLFRDDEVNRKGEVASQQLIAFFDGVLDQPARRDPDGLISALVSVEAEDERLDRMELIALCGLLLLAGFETTTNLIANSVHSLLAQPDQAAALRDGDVEAAMAVEELLRHDGPVQFAQRVLLEPLELAGQTIPERSLVALLIGAGNRDPLVFDRPDELDLARTPNPHLAFSSGIHHCLGAALARMEAAIAIPAILRHLPELELAGRPTRRNTFVLRGLTELPVRWRI
jgi:cytochrome P450